MNLLEFSSTLSAGHPPRYLVDDAEAAWGWGPPASAAVIEGIEVPRGTFETPVAVQLQSRRITGIGAALGSNQPCTFTPRAQAAGGPSAESPWTYLATGTGGYAWLKGVNFAGAGRVNTVFHAERLNSCAFFDLSFSGAIGDGVVFDRCQSLKRCGSITSAGHGGRGIVFDRCNALQASNIVVFDVGGVGVDIVAGTPGFGGGMAFNGMLVEHARGLAAIHIRDCSKAVHLGGCTWVEGAYGHSLLIENSIVVADTLHLSNGGTVANLKLINSRLIVGACYLGNLSVAPIELDAQSSIEGHLYTYPGGSFDNPAGTSAHVLEAPFVRSLARDPYAKR